VTRAKHGAHLPVVLTRREVEAVLGQLSELCRQMASLMDLDRGQIAVRQGKGAHERVTMLPDSLRPGLVTHLAAVKRLHDRDISAGSGSVALPGALSAKYPRAPWEWPRQWVFPATRHYIEPSTRLRHRHHFHEAALQRAFKNGVRRAGLTKPASCHSLRHSFLRPTFSRPGTTSGRFRNCLATAASPPR